MRLTPPVELRRTRQVGLTWSGRTVHYELYLEDVCSLVLTLNLVCVEKKHSQVGRSVDGVESRTCKDNHLGMMISSALRVCISEEGHISTCRGCVRRFNKVITNMSWC